MDARDYHIHETLADGARLTIRAIRPDDKSALVALFDRLSPESVYYRFHGAKKRLSRKELAYLTELDFHRQAALLALLSEGDEEYVAGVARYAVAPASPLDRAEMAITVADAEQGRGIGSLLLDHLVRVARTQDIRELEAYVLAENRPMIRLLERSGRLVARRAGGGVCHLILTTASEPTASAIEPGSCP